MPSHQKGTQLTTHLLFQLAHSSHGSITRRVLQSNSWPDCSDQSQTLRLSRRHILFCINHFNDDHCDSLRFNMDQLSLRPNLDLLSGIDHGRSELKLAFALLGLGETYKPLLCGPPAHGISAAPQQIYCLPYPRHPRITDLKLFETIHRAQRL